MSFDLKVARQIHELMWRWAFLTHQAQGGGERPYSAREREALAWALERFGREMPEETRVAEEWTDERRQRSNWGAK